MAYKKGYSEAEIVSKGEIERQGRINQSKIASMEE
jgi:hypothetical protein